MRRVRPGAKIETRKRITQAAALTVQGFTLAEIAERFSINPRSVGEWKTKYPTLWSFAYKEAMKGAVEIVRGQAGSDAVLADPDRYVNLAKQTEKWLSKRGETLFHVNDKPTLTTFLETHYIPTCLFEATAGTIQQYRVIVGQWRLLTGDPPLEEITTSLLAKYRDVLLKMRGRKPYERMHPRSVCSKLRVVHTLLAKAAKPGPRNRDAFGLIGEPPWIRPPRCPQTPRTIVSEQQISDLYLAAVCMEVPRIPGFKAPAWWRALIVVAWATGLRTSTLLTLRMDDIDWQEKCLRIPGERMKARRPHTAYLADTAVEHLRKIRTDRELVFPWDLNRRQLYFHMHKLQDAAGLPRKDHFAFQTIRRSFGTRLFAVSPGAAMMALGHAGLEVTRNCYINAQVVVQPAVQAMSQPPAFTGGPAT